MSNSRRLKRRKVSATHAQAVANTKKAARLLGCTCNIDLEVWHDADNLTHVTVRHDDWCPVIASGSWSNMVVAFDDVIE